MRLTLINQFYLPDISPTAHLCASLAEHRAELGDQVTVITGRAGYVSPISGGPVDGSVRVKRVPTSSLGSTSKFRRLIDWASFYPPAAWEALRLPRQDVVVALTTPPFIGWIGALHKQLHAGTRLVLWCMDCYPEALERTGMLDPASIPSRAMRAMNRALFRRLDHLICLDPAMAELLLSQYAPRGAQLKWSIIPNWERAAAFPPGPPPVAWDAPVVEQIRGKFAVLYLGNAGYGHDFATMLDAAQMLRNEPVVFLMVGGGALRPWIASESARRGLTNIVLHDYVPKELTRSVMARADAALITLEEPLAGVMSPSKLHANLATGLPIIYVGPEASNVDEAISRFGCGVSLRPGDAAGLTTAVRQWRHDSGELRRRARQAFDESYCDRRTLPEFDRIFSDLRRR